MFTTRYSHISAVPLLCAVFLSTFFLRSIAHARLSSPGNVTFSSPTSLSTNAVFDSTGTFILQLSAFDNAKTSTATLTVTVNAPLSPSIVGGTASAIAGNGVDVMLSFTTGTLAVSSLQFDLALPVGISTNTITTGSAATAAGKSAQMSVVPGGVRILVFGVNQTLLGSGPIATLNLRLSPTLPTGPQTLVLSGIVSSDPGGVSVPTTDTDASINVTANKAPTLTVGTNQTIILPTSATLTGTGSDDGAPNPPGVLTYSWSVL